MERTRKFASDFLWKMKKNPLVKEEKYPNITITYYGDGDSE
jgi:deoxyribodipyrimidine photo-lyase